MLGSTGDVGLKDEDQFMLQELAQVVHQQLTVTFKSRKVSGHQEHHFQLEPHKGRGGVGGR